MTARVEHLRERMLHHLDAAEQAEDAYKADYAQLLARHRRRCRTEREARLNARIDAGRDPGIRVALAMVDDERSAARTCAAVLMAELAYLDHPIAAGEAARPAPRAVPPLSARQSPNRTPTPSRAGVDHRSPATPRTHTAPATAPAERPGTGPTRAGAVR